MSKDRTNLPTNCLYILAKYNVKKVFIDNESLYFSQSSQMEVMEQSLKDVEEILISGVTFFKCPLCIHITKEMAFLKRHIIRHYFPDLTNDSLSRFMEFHSIRPDMYKCQKCEFESNKIFLLRYHEKTHDQCIQFHDKPAPPIRDKCDYISKFISYVNRSEINDDGTNDVLKCPFCKYQTNRYPHLKNHMLVHNDTAALYKCEKCPFVTKRKGSLKTHSLLHDDSHLMKCSRCPYTTRYKNHYKNHVISHDDTAKSLQCPNCKYQTKIACKFRNHMVKHDETVPVMNCDKCSFQTKYLSRFNYHIKTHDESLFPLNECDKCSYQTTNKQRFQKHTSVHDGESTRKHKKNCDKPIIL